FSSRRRHTRFSRDWSSDVCSSDLGFGPASSFAKFWLLAKNFLGALLSRKSSALTVSYTGFWSLPLPLYTVLSSPPALGEVSESRSEERRVRERDESWVVAI